MKYRRLGKTNLAVSVIGVGTWQYGGEWGKTFTQSEVDAILGRALDLGINLIDSAECYGDHVSEALVGEAVKGKRDRWILATKFGHKFHANFKRTEHWSAAEVQQQLEASLKALQTDYIDIYQAHGDHMLGDQELWQMLADLVKAGKIRHVGMSIRGNNFSAETTHLAPGLNVEVIQVVYNRLDRKPENAILPACLEHDLGVLARVPLASGFLSGKYKPGTHFQDENDVRTHQNPEEVQHKLRQVEEIRRKELPRGVNMAAWALAWCLRNPAITCVIPGMKNVEQVNFNASAADLVA
jgi:aryl-alcohol dehydrogenase-like predicted oxidoreductase